MFSQYYPLGGIDVVEASDAAAVANFQQALRRASVGHRRQVAPVPHVHALAESDVAGRFDTCWKHDAGATAECAEAPAVE